MDTAQIKRLQERIGTQPDGFWGPMSELAVKRHLYHMIRSQTPWPSPNEKELQAFYGEPGPEHIINLDVKGLGLEYIGKPVNSIRCHKKVGPDLKDILTEISLSPFAYVLRQYLGCYEDRNIRGGTRKSLHARGAAIDFMAATNGNNTHWPTKADMPIEVMEIFARHGWTPAGAFWGRDSMHFQASKPIKTWA